MANIEEFLSNNAEYAASFTDGHLAMPPSRQVAVLACMDARLHPEKVLGIKNGESHCIRNAGGRASEDALRSLVISERLLGTKEIIIVHHTDCGMLTFTNEQLRAKIQDDLGVDVGDRDFLPFPDLEQSVRDDVEIIRNSPLIPKDIPITGTIYDVKTGKVTEVVRA